MFFSWNNMRYQFKSHYSKKMTPIAEAIHFNPVTGKKAKSKVAQLLKTLMYFQKNISKAAEEYLQPENIGTKTCTALLPFARGGALTSEKDGYVRLASRDLQPSV